MRYKTITLDELNCWKKGKCNIPKKAFLVVADDGLTSVHKYAEPILKKYGYRSLVNEYYLFINLENNM